MLDSAHERNLHPLSSGILHRLQWVTPDRDNRLTLNDNPLTRQDPYLLLMSSQPVKLPVATCGL